MNTYLPSFATLLVSAQAIAQCALQPLPTGAGVPSLDGVVSCSTTWDPDGPGPAPARLVVAGPFTLAGALPVAGLAVFEPATNTWSSLGSLPAIPTGLAAQPNGALFASGHFPTSPTSAALVVQWTGASWIPVAPATGPFGARALAVSALGEPWLNTAVSFTSGGVCRFTGGAWQVVGTPGHLNSPEIQSIAIAPNGDVWAGGVFSTMNGVPADSIARWNGTAWSGLGSGIAGRVHAIAFASNGDAYVGGQFLLAGGALANNVARWNGTSWSPLGSGTTHPFSPAGTVLSLAIEPNGDVVAAGTFALAGGAPASLVARWNGAAWSAMGTGIDPIPVGGGDPSVATVQSLGSEVFAGGNFARAGGPRCHGPRALERHQLGTRADEWHRARCDRRASCVERRRLPRRLLPRHRWRGVQRRCASCRCDMATARQRTRRADAARRGCGDGRRPQR